MLSYVSGLIAGILVFVVLRLRSARKGGPLPPGPKPLPLLGNVLDFPREQEWLTWQSLIHRYGDLVYLSALGRGFLLLGSHKVITELIEKRLNFNDRPRFAMFHDLMSLDWALAVMPYGDYWRRSRKLLHAHAHAGAAVAYQPTQMSSARRFVGDLLDSEASRPIDHLSESAKAVLPRLVRTNFGLTALRMIYGIDVRNPNSVSKYINTSEGVLHAINEAGVPGRFLVDLFPWLKYIPSWLPGASFQSFAAKTRTLHQQMRDDPVAVTKTQLAAGTAPVSIVARMFESDPEDEQLVKDIAGSVYLGGSDTTVSAVTSFFLAALVYPDVQTLAKQELDRVVGRERLPEFSDKAELPYLEAVMRECLRWLPVIPNGIPHSTMEDTEFRGYFIPKGTVILAFQWGLLHDPQHYPDPSSFSPERHLVRLADGSWKLRTDVPDPRNFAFGFGRRVCPGIHIAEQSLFATLATVLHTLDIMRAKDQDGKEIVPDVQVNSGALCHPLPFPYELRMREDARELLEMCSNAAEVQ